MATTPPPTIDEGISASESAWSAASKPSDGLMMGELRIEFEQTTLSDVLGQIGFGVIERQGDAGENVYWLCYSAVAGGANARLWIEASGEMGGPKHSITEIALQRVAQDRAPLDCPSLPNQFEPVSFNNGAGLGTTKMVVRHAFPSGLLTQSERDFIGYHGKVTDNGHCEGGFDLLNSLYLTFQDGVVTEIDAGQVTSC